MDVIWHHSPSNELVIVPPALSILNCYSEEVRDARIFQPARSGRRSVQRTIHGGECMTRRQILWHHLTGRRIACLTKKECVLGFDDLSRSYAVSFARREPLRTMV